MSIPAYVLLPFAAVCAVVALLLWLVFLRPADRKVGQGAITRKIFKPAGEYVQYPSGMRDAFLAPARIPTGECYIFAVRVDGLSADAGVALNTLAAEEYEVGQRVSIEYQERGLPGVWKKVYVTRMSR
jgi:hypothetical protein